MARITQHRLVQRVDDLVVFVDESSGEEVAFPVSAIPTLIRVLQYFGSADV